MNDPNDPNYRPKDNRMLGIGLSAAAAVLMIYACFSHRWLENAQFRDARIGISLTSVQGCMGGECESKSNFEVMAEARRHSPKQASSVFAPMGIATLILLALSALALLATAGLAFKQLRPALPMPPPTFALLTIFLALITGTMFIATKPGGVGAVGVGLGFWAFGVASVMGIVGAQLLLKLVKPVDPDLAATPY